jgi:hypothetical protein
LLHRHHAIDSVARAARRNQLKPTSGLRVHSSPGHRPRRCQRGTGCAAWHRLRGHRGHQHASREGIVNDLNRYRSTARRLSTPVLRREPIPTERAFHNSEVGVMQTARVDRHATYEQVVPKTGARHPDLVVSSPQVPPTVPTTRVRRPGLGPPVLGWTGSSTTGRVARPAGSLPMRAFVSTASRWGCRFGASAGG